jgi:hypothetical protein
MGSEMFKQSGTPGVQKSEIAPQVAGIVPRSDVEQKAVQVSSSWSGQTQIAFRSLVAQWSGKYLEPANRLVSDWSDSIFSPFSDENKIPLFIALKAARSDGEASAALGILVRDGRDMALEILRSNKSPTQKTDYFIEKLRLAK